MKTQNFLRFMGGALAALIVISGIGCSSGGSGSSGGGSATAASTVSMAATPNVVAAGATINLTPTGGTAPYTFMLINSIGGTLSNSTGTTAIYTAPTNPSSTTQQISISDSSSPPQIVYFPVTITTSGTTTGTTSLTVNPQNSTVAPNSLVTLYVSGGSGTYTYTTNGGSFGSANGNVPSLTAGNTVNFFAPATGGVTVTITIQDSLTSTIITTALVSVTATTTANAAPSCTGNFTVYVDGTAGSLFIATDPTSNVMTGTLSLPLNDGSGQWGYAQVNGGCVNGSISFINAVSGSTYVGNVNSSYSRTFSGFFTDPYYPGYQFPWSAVQQ